MSIVPTIIESLQELGLTKREAEVYVTIWSKGGATVKDLLDTLDVHQPQLYNIIQSLIRKGFIKASAGRPRVYTAVDIGAIIDVQKMKLDSLKSSLVKELEYLKTVSSNEEPYISIIRSLEGIIAGIIEVINSSEIELRLEVPYQIFKKVEDYILNAVRRGVNVYVLVYPEKVAFHDDFKKHSTNVRIRVSELGNFLLVIGDLSKAIYSKRRFFSPTKLPPSSTEIYGYEIHEKDLLLRLLNIHNVLWRKAKEVIGWKPGTDVYPKDFLEFSLVLDELESLLRMGYSPYVTVEGRDVREGTPIKLFGRVRGINKSEIISNFVLETEEGVFSVGGFDAEVEDIEAQKVTIERVEG
ncbi:TrmB family transcriptional regulator [Pyrococcus sp. ST04]|uniref:TrmB family transcriptional regulator n=1 Tax=Pyrococcus sp. ST04 TaxID=1183377 RepID=UPI0002605D5E|nr:TrmB family transcriptional regulator [Pyrococcus sp. ST04]AFK23076.1 transcriptional regulator, TrmB family [Pyrococcus sp. ST04]